MSSRRANLPEKTCRQCGRPFRWRKKWERDWPNVLYCSRRCRRAAKSETRSGTTRG
ncbi:DUF2256 domain-containing protein [Stratiformator vulcanicus]|uniref:DUF2256 domain-containing protein n=1 Tax=Stratiformator vulcanicus TaxID=2527980 RepID=UPI0011A053B5|nr:DUF2256 domain-containing protein [Stratiformator vulcanicus]